MPHKNTHYLYGLHAIDAIIDNPLRSIEMLYVNQERHDQRITSLLAKAREKNIPITLLDSVNMKKKFPDKHQGIVAIAHPIPQLNETDLERLLASKSNLLILILDGITDPHNLGACLRTADAVGVDFIITPKDNSAPINATVSKVASGAMESIPIIRVTNLARTLKTLKSAGIWVYGAAGEATQNLYELDLKDHAIAIVMGAEGSGLRRLTKEYCDNLFSIPMHGNVSSLNVSVATGVCLYEIIRQRSTR